LIRGSSSSYYDWCILAPLYKAHKVSLCLISDPKRPALDKTGVQQFFNEFLTSVSSKRRVYLQKERQQFDENVRPSAKCRLLVHKFALEEKNEKS